jgi:ferredoxin-NADP reductase
VHRVYTRKIPAGYPRPPERIIADDLSDPDFGPDREPQVFVCGPNGFVEAAANLLITLGHSADDIKTERFGPTGGPP